MGKLVFLSYPENCESAAFVETASAIEFNIDVADRQRGESSLLLLCVTHFDLYSRVRCHQFICVCTGFNVRHE